MFFLWLYFALQYCIGFAIHQHESATGVHVFPVLNPPPSPYHFSGSSQCTSPKHPVSCIEPSLAIHFLYDTIHISMPFSKIIPPTPSPTESKRLFYTSNRYLDPLSERRLPCWLRRSSICLQCRRPWVGKISWRRKWLPTPVFLPGKFHGQRSLAGYSLCGRKESDTTEPLHFISLHYILGQREHWV